MATIDREKAVQEIVTLIDVHLFGIELSSSDRREEIESDILAFLLVAKKQGLYKDVKSSTEIPPHLVKCFEKGIYELPSEREER